MAILTIRDEDAVALMSVLAERSIEYMLSNSATTAETPTAHYDMSLLPVDQLTKLLVALQQIVRNLEEATDGAGKIKVDLPDNLTRVAEQLASFQQWTYGTGFGAFSLAADNAAYAVQHGARW